MRTPPKNRMDLATKTFGRLTVLREADHCGSVRQWLCQCSCGQQTTVRQGQLISGKTTSCGCLHREVIGKIRRTHGQSSIPEYKIWKGMRQRCTNPAEKSYPRYGGRGIVVCSEWNESFETFFADMGPRPSPRHSIDRIDNDKGYQPDNCRWSLPAEQNSNTRANRKITYNGETRLLSEWAHRIGVSPSLLHMRVGKLGWTIERALTTPPK